MCWNFSAIRDTATTQTGLHKTDVWTSRTGKEFNFINNLLYLEGGQHSREVGLCLSNKEGLKPKDFEPKSLGGKETESTRETLGQRET